jgi:hypothetical protein
MRSKTCGDGGGRSSEQVGAVGREEEEGGWGWVGYQWAVPQEK